MNHRLRVPQVPRKVRTLARAFTLLEVLVALGAVALISIGLARIFGATSETLRAGRRLSHFNDYARTLERSMREDFKRMTRRGFLVIAHEATENKVYRSRADASIPPAAFANSANDPRYRVRRIDQIMFFEAGKFQTQRTPLYPTRVASGAEAMVYYGHGLRQEPGTPNLAIPSLDDPNRDGSNTDSGGESDAAPFFGEAGPNQYASDWILLRQLCVLGQPKVSPPPRPNGLAFPTNDQWGDQPIQIDLAPAQSSLFRNIARGTPSTLPGANQLARAFDAGVPRPLIASGLVDLIATNLSTVRSIVLDAQPIQSSNPPVVFDENWAAGDEVSDRDYDGNGTPDGPAIPYAFKPDLTAAGTQACGAMKQWMLQGLPAEPQKQTSNGAAQPPMPAPAAAPGFGGRIHCELTPPDYLGTQANNGNVYVGNEDYRRTDQVMLTSANLAPACTEMIIEWSFGETYIGGTTPDPFLSGATDPRANQLIWHGLERFAQTDFDPSTSLDQNDRIAGPYYGKVDDATPNGASGSALPRDAHFQRIDLSNGSTEAWLVKSHVIQEPVDNQGLPDPRPGEPFYSIFGYVDPTYPGPAGAGSVTSANEQWKYRRPDTIACAWPRLIRVTITLADPTDPSFEQTYQFVFEVPDDTRSGSGG